MKNQNLLISLTLIILFSGISFFAGTKYQASKVPTFDRNAAFANGRNGNSSGQNGGRRAGGQVSGEIISVDNNSVTVKLSDGSSKIVLLTSNSSIVNSVAATTADLKVGTKVAIFGTTNTDGSVTAQNVQLNPVVRIPSTTITPQK